ncbi:hypothetical protein BKA66DRAFT_440437 [Pyrenochaeta sp. MPI-SDFR-AT-0127]|nr:hypothetical protein BKA66DRAFT_440437 [Pyrenochaeta sp. MPI-SDFR-AT-0127]
MATPTKTDKSTTTTIVLVKPKLSWYVHAIQICWLLIFGVKNPAKRTHSATDVASLVASVDTQERLVVGIELLHTDQKRQLAQLDHATHGRGSMFQVESIWGQIAASARRSTPDAWGPSWGRICCLGCVASSSRGTELMSTNGVQGPELLLKRSTMPSRPPRLAVYSLRRSEGSSMWPLTNYDQASP